jgi:hypothetical protein
LAWRSRSWQHDGSSPGMNKLSFGNCFVTAAFEDMLIKLRRTLIAARFSGTRPAQPTDDQIRAVFAAWDAAAA